MFYSRSLKISLSTLSLLLLGCLLLQLTTCYRASKTPGPPPLILFKDPEKLKLVPPPAKTPEQLAKDEERALALAQIANNLEKKGYKNKAERRRQEIIQKYPLSTPAGWLLEKRAKEAELAEKDPEALRYYELLLFYQPGFSRAPEARKNYLKLLVKNNRLEDALSILPLLYEHAVNLEQKEIGLIFIDTLIKTGKPLEACKLYIDLRTKILKANREQPLNPVPLPTLAELPDLPRIIADNTQGLPDNELEALWDVVAKEEAARPLYFPLGLRTARYQISLKNIRKGLAILQDLDATLNKNPEPQDLELYQSQIKILLEQLASRFIVNPQAVGILLPLSGYYQPFGERSLSAIKLAFKDNPDIRLIIKDTESNPLKINQTMEELILKEHVIAIIGPLAANEAEEAAKIAENFSVPIISLSHKENLTAIGPYVFRSALTVKAQAETLARFATKELKFSTFAMLYPNNTYGNEFVQNFWDTLENEHLGEIRGLESYEPKQTTFTEAIQRLVGKFYKLARPDFADNLKLIKDKKLAPLAEKQEIEKLSKSLHAIVDFEALVIPAESDKQIGLIAPALVFEDIVLTQDPEALEKIRKATNNPHSQPVTLLGASTWNRPQILNNCEHYCEKAIFVDAYFLDNPSMKVQSFISDFKQLTKVTPLLPEAQAFDTANIVKKLLLEQHPTTREALVEHLHHLSYEGVTGKISFNAQGEAERDLFILKIENNTIQSYYPL